MSSGGSHTWWAGVPKPVIRSTAMSSIDFSTPSAPTTGVAGRSSSSTGAASCFTSAIENGKMPCSLPPSSRRIREPAAGGPETYAARNRCMLVGSGFR